MDEDQSLPIPLLEEHDEAAVFAVLVRLIRTDLGNQRDKEQIELLQESIKARSADRPKYMATLDAFGFAIDTPGLWERVKLSLGAENFARAFRVAFPDEYPAPVASSEKVIAPPIPIMSDPPRGDGEAASRRADYPPPKISDAILDFLRSVGDRGAHVADIKRHLSDVHSIETHEKTPGMTLYRLSKEKLVRREGRVWYAIDSANASGLEASIVPDEMTTATDL